MALRIQLRGLFLAAALPQTAQEKGSPSRGPPPNPLWPLLSILPLSSPPFWSSCSLPFYAPKLGAPSAEPGRTQLSNPRPCLQPRPSSKGQCAITGLRRLLVQAPYRGFKEEEAALSGELRLHAHRFPQAR